jgi:hypothetical protein
MPEANARAIQFYRQAINLGQRYAVAWAALTFTHATSTLNSDTRPVDLKWDRYRRDPRFTALARCGFPPGS